jgi:hypothetical protein
VKPSIIFFNITIIMMTLPPGCLTKLRCIVIGDLLKLAPKLLERRVARSDGKLGIRLAIKAKALKQLPAMDDYRYTIISMHMACLRSRPGKGIICMS